ncbi:hypothetical protein D0911_07830 [Zhongshania marina]|uniref:Outer membrane lipoprotein n=1 Tax=Zhongshania marina TaxID=2304603 RepID=A0ABX9W5M2_9GAMM|nr:hypothetical protein D0911_07830 [Zhongshania marina]
MRILVVPLVLLISGCVSVVSDDVAYSNFVGKRYQLEVDARVFETGCSSSWSGKYLLAPGDFEITPDKRFGQSCPSKLVGELPKHTIVEVREVLISEWFGGACYRVLIAPLSGDFKAVNIDVPACLHHPRPYWIYPSYPSIPGQLGFKQEYFIPAELP